MQRSRRAAAASAAGFALRALRSIAGLVCLVFAGAYQLRVMTYFLPRLVADRHIWPAIYYGFWLIAVCTTLAVLAFRQDILKRTLPVLILCALASALPFVHEIDQITKIFFVAMGFFACAAVLSVLVDPLTVLRISALATVAGAVICLVDVLFASGRAAGLSIAPNVAAAALLLGSSAAYLSIPARWLGYFLLIVGAALFVTLSKSTLLAACGIFAIVVIGNRLQRLRFPRFAWRPHTLVALGLVAWIGVALSTNDRFVFATSNAYRVFSNAVPASQAARSTIEKAVTLASADPDVMPTEALIAEIGRRSETESDVNSISARWLLMERAWLVFKGEPFSGLGFASAYALEPHNTFLLFMLAFGPIGLLVPLAFLAVIAYPAIRFKSISLSALPMAAFAVLMTSHNMLFDPGLLAPLAFGWAGAAVAGAALADQRTWPGSQ
ncbi:O-Antigen ligase [Bradyrhizobium erythrophlei]|jgi:hypothetical protein|uniref:O-Antigen ligase n=2 Tax=Bradyrhizobium erythrophlei TaxID=1437360 RepID=A0A1M5RZA0_9BRAD|nr:O-Antigen ligase [Bradyrhizobium erythrophlei]